VTANTAAHYDITF